MKPVRTVLLAAIVALAAGCSLVDLAYNNAPNLVAGRIDEAFDLDRQQLEQLEQRLQQFFAWHRANELPRYRELLQTAAADAADGVSATEFMALNQALRDAVERSVEKAVDSIGDLASTLTPHQIEHFDRYFHDTSDKYRDYLDKSEQQREIYRVERALERLENWYGDFDERMERRVRARLEQLPDLRLPWINYREQRHRALLVALRDAGAANPTPRLKQLLLDPDTDFAREFEPESRRYWQAFAAALEDISSWMQMRHTRRVVSKLENYAHVAERLGASG